MTENTEHVESVEIVSEDKPRSIQSYRHEVVRGLAKAHSGFRFAAPEGFADATGEARSILRGFKPTSKDECLEKLNAAAAQIANAAQALDGYDADAIVAQILAARDAAGAELEAAASTLSAAIATAQTRDWDAWQAAKATRYESYDSDEDEDD